MRAYERFLNYARIHTQSSEETGVTPSTPCQWDLARELEREMKELGLSDVKLDENCIVTGYLPATLRGRPCPGPAGPYGYRPRLFRGKREPYPPREL